MVLQCLTSSPLASWYQFMLLGEQGHQSLSSLTRAISQKVGGPQESNWQPFGLRNRNGTFGLRNRIGTFGLRNRIGTFGLRNRIGTFGLRNRIGTFGLRNRIGTFGLRNRIGTFGLRANAVCCAL